MGSYSFQVVALSVPETPPRPWWVLDVGLRATTRVARHFVSVLDSNQSQDGLGMFGNGATSLCPRRIHDFMQDGASSVAVRADLCDLERDRGAGQANR